VKFVIYFVYCILINSIDILNMQTNLEDTVCLSLTMRTPTSP